MKLAFRGQRILIAGGTCDLALCLSESLIEEGLHPVLTWRSEGGKNRILERLHPFDGQFETTWLDLSQRESIESLFMHLENDLDYLVDFAQGDFESLVGSADPETIQRYFSENVSSRAELLRSAARSMLRKRHGRMVFVSSAAVLRTNPGQGFYAAAKTASESLYRNLGIELAKRGITTVTLRPGYVDSGRGARYVGHREEILDGSPLGRILRPEEVAEAILFFLSDHASAFNATEICMDGGFTAAK